MAITLYQVKIAAPGLRREYILNCLNEYGFPGFIHHDWIDVEPSEKSKVKKKKRLAWYQPNFKCPIGCCFKDIQERQDYRINLQEIIQLAKSKNIIVQKSHPNPGERDLDIEDRKELRLKEEPFRKKILNMSYSPKHAHAKTNTEKLS
jgi:hypothetical protein